MVFLNFMDLHIYLFHEQNPKSWAKQIQEEWKILEKHLPGQFSIPNTKSPNIFYGILLNLTICSTFSLLLIRYNICESLRIKDGSHEGCDYWSRRDSLPRRSFLF